MFEYDTLAKYYELYYGDRAEDIEFWKTMATRVGSPILELSCGSGRLTIPMAQTGTVITGIDVSVRMLDLAKKKLKTQPHRIRKRITLVKGNTTLFSLRKKFKAIFCPEAFWAVSDEETDSMMNSIITHLVPDGHLIMSIYNFHERAEDLKSHHLKLCKRFPEKGYTLVRQSYVEGKKGSPIDRIIHFLDRVYDNGTMKRVITERTERQRTKDELVSILRTYGFTIKKIYGEYDMTSWSDTTKWTIVVAQLSSTCFIERLTINLTAWFQGNKNRPSA